MQALLRHDYFKIFVVLLCQLLIFVGGFQTYFHQDDFIDLSLSQNWDQVVKAFNIFSPAVDFQFYRPVSVQLYFFINKILFGWNVFGYHVLTMILLFLASFLVFLLAKRLFKNSSMALVAMVFFALNPTHFAAANSAAYAHETLLVIFSVATIYLLDIFNATGRIKFLFFGFFTFLVALATKETAVVIPGLYVLITYLQTGKIFSKRSICVILISTIILGIYLFSHVKFYGMPVNSSYKIILGKPTIAISGWYFLWSLGAPNFLIDFVGSKLKLSDVFWLVTELNGVVFFTIFGTLIASLLTGIFYLVRRGIKVIIPALVFILWFLVSILPVAIFPLHKLAIEQTLGLVGISLFLAWMGKNIRGKSPLLVSILLPLFLINSINTIILAQKNHWIRHSASIAQRTVKLLDSRLESIPKNSVIYFKDGVVKISTWGSSRQIYYATGNGKGLDLLYKQKGWKFVFEDQVDKRNVPNDGYVIISSDEII